MKSKESKYAQKNRKISRNCQKKSQVTLFIIAGIVFVIAAGMFFVLVSKKASITETDPEITHITGFVGACLEKVAKPSIELAGMQGGRIILPKQYLSTNDFDVAYGYFLGNVTLASKSEMENELGTHIDSRLMQCIDNFSSFPGREIEFKSPSTSAEILEHKVIINTIFPVKTKGKKIERFSTEVPFAVGRAHSTAEAVIENIKEEPDCFDFSYLSNFEGVKVNLVPAGEDTLLYFLLDDTNYLFVFASKIAVKNAKSVN